MQPVEKYVHHKLDVTVLSEVKGKHQKHCLCFNDCGNFHPEKPEQNCQIANAVFKNCVKFGIVTPVYECPMYKAVVPVPENLEDDIELVEDQSTIDEGLDLEPADVPSGDDLPEGAETKTTSDAVAPVTPDNADPLK